MEWQYIDFAADTNNINIETGAGEQGLIELSLEALDGVVRGIGGFTIDNQPGARGALDRARQNIENLSAARGKLGAGLSRLGIANNLLYSQATEKEAAKSQILDADIAAETAEFVKNQILQQSIASLLAQTNVNQQLVLQLLGVDSSN